MLYGNTPAMVNRPGTLLAGLVLVVGTRRAEGRMRVGRDLIDCQGDRLGATGFGQRETVALVQRKAAAQVGQGEGDCPSPP